MKEKLIGLIKEIAVPRQIGKKGEIQTQIYLKKKIEKRQLSVQTDKVEYNPLMFSYMQFLFALAWMLFFLQLVFFLVEFHLGQLITYAIGFPILGYYFWKRMRFEIDSPIGETKTTKNLYSDIPCNRYSNLGFILVISHYDSVGRRFSYSNTKKCLLFASISGLGSFFINLFYIVGFFTESSWNIQGLGIVNIFLHLFCLFVLIPLILNHAENTSPGANDNASGCAVNLALLERFSETPLEWLPIRFLFTGAEEIGLEGAIAHLIQHRTEYQKYLKIYVINLDMVGQNFGFLSSMGTIKKIRLDHSLNQLTQHTAHQMNLSLKPNPVKFGFFSDFYPFLDLPNAEVTSFSSHQVSDLHGLEDSIDKIDPIAVLDCYELLSRVILNLDRKIQYRLETGK